MRAENSPAPSGNKVWGIKKPPRNYQEGFLNVKSPYENVITYYAALNTRV